MPNSTRAVLAASAACMLLSACGGSASGGLVSASSPVPIPSPTSTPTPTPTPAPIQAADDTTVELLATLATQELAVVTHDDPIQIRYDASRNVYELKAGNFDWSAFTDPPAPSGDAPNFFFEIADQPVTSFFIIRAHNRSSEPERHYLYSNLAYWNASGAEGGFFGNVAAFGAATPAAGVPLSGTASFEGFAMGQADVANEVWGFFSTTPLEGTVKLNFDFAAGSLAGSLNMGNGNCDCEKFVSTGIIAFSNTVFSRGSQTFSGSFASGAQGVNSFDGRFTGPRAEELIGSWSLPFLFEGATHQAWGTWIAKRGN